MLPRIFSASSVLVIASLAAGCGGYAARMDDALSSIAAGQYDSGLEAIDSLVARGEAGKSPEDKDLPLLLLERATLYQALGDHQLAVADFSAADQMLEILDLTPDKAGKAAEYLWSASKSVYKAPVYEKLMVNMTAIASYLASGQFSSAMVEARRILVLAEYYENIGLEAHPALAAAYYLAGIAMEAGGNPSEAFPLYARALRIGELHGLAEAVLRTADSSLSNDGEIVTLAQELAGPVSELPADQSEVFAIILAGRGPRRIAEYLPIGAVFSYMVASQAYALSAEQERQYNRMIAEGLLTWVNYPRLEIANNEISVANVSAGESTITSTVIANMESLAIEQWEHERPGIAFAAITRAIVRVIAREAVQATTSQGSQTAQTLGFLAGLAVQGAMQAADVPDTRTWSLMPAYISFARIPVQSGSQIVRVVSVGGADYYSEEFAVDVPAGGTAFVAARIL